MPQFLCSDYIMNIVVCHRYNLQLAGWTFNCKICKWLSKNTFYTFFSQLPHFIWQIHQTLSRSGRGFSRLHSCPIQQKSLASQACVCDKVDCDEVCVGEQSSWNVWSTELSQGNSSFNSAIKYLERNWRLHLNSISIRLLRLLRIVLNKTVLWLPNL